MSNKDVVRRFIDDVVTEKDYELARELLSADYERHDPDPEFEGRGPEPFIERLRGIESGIPDAAWSIGEIIADGDLVAFEGTMSGTHEGEFMGIEPTGRSFSIQGNAMHRVEGGQITETWATWDILGMMQQVGAVETPSPGD
jgi:predicted ester cyclase